MKEERDYIQDIAEIRTMMVRSSKFLSLSGWAGIMAGIYALAGAHITYRIMNFNPDGIIYEFPDMMNVVLLAIFILILAISTAVFLSYKSAHKRGETLWNPTSKRLLTDMAVPLIAGGLAISVLIFNTANGLVMPLTLLFYGLALFNAGRFTYSEVRMLGFIQMALGLMSLFFIEYSIFIWAFGFGIVHIIYGIYMHYRYER